jgi:ABC-type transporter Mla MlaB component
MLRISISEGTEAVEMKLEGRVAGLWTAEVSRVWVETAPRLAGRTLVLDLRNVIYADSGGTALLSEIYSQTKAKVVADTVWAQSLADQIMRSDAQQVHEEI